MTVVGWDIGGVNTKAALVANGRICTVVCRPFEIQRAPHDLSAVLMTLASDCGAPDNARHAVTMTAELSQAFHTKRDGVAHIVSAVQHAFPRSQLLFYGVDERFHEPDVAVTQPLLVAAANWVATAAIVAREVPNAILIDIGTTTTDIIPIVAGKVAAVGRTDPDRLARGELVYTGAVRTPVEAIVSHVPLAGQNVGVSAEGFALSGDVHVWRGTLSPDDYVVTPPDRGARTRDGAAVRLARVVCADREMLDDAAITAIADAVAKAQTSRVATALRWVHQAHPRIRHAVVTGVGSFLARDAAVSAGLQVILLSDRLGRAAAHSAPAVAVALLADATIRRTATA